MLHDDTFQGRNFERLYNDGTITDVCSQSCYIENWTKLKKSNQNQRKSIKIKENQPKLNKFDFSKEISDENRFLQFHFYKSS